MAGETCLLMDAKGRTYLVALTEGGEFQYHAGVVPHAEIIGSEEGVALLSSRDSRLVAVRPRLAEYILTMKRGPQVVYPKDIGPILVWADIGPGNVVVEAGTGSGALTMALARAVGPTGRVVSVERRADHHGVAVASLEGFFGSVPDHVELREGEVVDAIADVRPDRVVLDIPTPWEVVPAAVEAMRSGGIFCAYVPTVPQVQQTREALRTSKRFVAMESFEVLHRDWVADGRSVRPEHQMVAHTGFITVARLVAARRQRRSEVGDGEGEEE